MCVLRFRTPVRATPYDESGFDPINAKSAILIEETTGKILYAKNENFRVYPAGTTKILTCLTALSELDLSEYVTVGEEISTVEPDLTAAGVKRGEVFSVDNMIRMIIIPAGNEMSCVAARAVAKKITGEKNIPYADAEALFCGLMNEKAAETGALHSYFVNPHGYHDDDHITTAYDMALICRAAIQNPLLRAVFSESVYGMEDVARENLFGAPGRQFETRNELLLADGANYYPYATGIKAGSTSAGECLAASAVKNGMTLIALIFDSPDGGRWNDAKNLFEYGFLNYSHATVHSPGEIIASVFVTNPKLGDPKYIDCVTGGYFRGFFAKEDLERITRDIIYRERYLTPDHKRDLSDEHKDAPQFFAPVEMGDVVGKVVYSLDGETIFEANLIAAQSAGERTKETDRAYYKHLIKTNIFTVYALPFWCALFAIIFSATQAAVFFRKRRKSNRLIYAKPKSK